MAKQDHTEEVFEGVEQTLSKTEKWIEDNRNLLGIIIGVIVGIAGIFYGYQKFVVEPANAEANEQIWFAQKYFSQDSLNLALNGDGQNMGFIDIADEYSSTKAGNLANYYAGISFLRTGNYESAIEHLDKFSSDDEILSVEALGAIGDAFHELNQPEEALEYYKKATSINNNNFINPIYLQRAANTADILGDYDQMLSLLEELKEKYPKSREVADVEKWIEYARAKAQN